MNAAAPVIMTALMDRRAVQRLDDLRQAHFPPERNMLRAHLTMFHHLPGPQAADLIADVRDAARHEATMTARATGMMFMGRGSAVRIECLTLAAFRARLADTWHDLLVPQDRQGWRPHVTIQNKVDPKRAKALYADLSTGFVPWELKIEGVSLHWYRGGPWDHMRDVRFSRSSIRPLS